MPPPMRSGPVRCQSSAKLPSSGEKTQCIVHKKAMTESRLLRPTRASNVDVVGPSASYSRITIIVAAGAVAMAMTPKNSPISSEVWPKVKGAMEVCNHH